MEVSPHKVRDSGRYFSYIGSALLSAGTYDHQVFLLHNSTYSLLRNNNFIRFQSTIDAPLAITLISLYEFLLYSLKIKSDMIQ